MLLERELKEIKTVSQGSSKNDSKSAKLAQANKEVSMISDPVQTSPSHIFDGVSHYDRNYQRVRHMTPDREIFVLREELKRLLQESDMERMMHRQEVHRLKKEIEHMRSKR